MVLENLLKLFKEDDMDFFEKYILTMPIEEQKRFWEEHPDFLAEYEISIGDIELLQDSVYRRLCREIMEVRKKKEDEE